MKPSAIRTSGEMRLLSNEYLTKKATARNAANPPTQASSFTPMNCSQLMAGTRVRAGWSAGVGWVLMPGKGCGAETAAAITEIGGGAEVIVISSSRICGGAGCAGALAGCRWTASAAATAATAGISGVAGATGGADAISFFSRKTSPSSEPRRRLSSSRLCRAPTARAISQITKAIGAPMRTNTRSM